MQPQVTATHALVHVFFVGVYQALCLLSLAVVAQQQPVRDVMTQYVAQATALSKPDASALGVAPAGRGRRNCMLALLRFLHCTMVACTRTLWAASLAEDVATLKQETYEARGL